MSHKYDHLARKLTAPLWECVRKGLADLRDWLQNSADEMQRIKRAVENAENFARDALIQMAAKLMVFPAKVRKSGEGSATVLITPKSEARAPLFRLGLEAAEKEPATLVESYDRAASTPPSYTSIEIIERRIAALEDVLAEPGKHAARMRRALFKREVETPQPILLKDEDTVLLDHIDRCIDDPDYINTAAGRKTHTLILDSS